MNVTVGPKLLKAVNTFENANQKMLYDFGVDKISLAGVDITKAAYAINNSGLNDEQIKEATNLTATDTFNEANYVNNIRNYMKINLYDSTYDFAEKLKFFLQTLGNGFESVYVLSRT